MDVLEELRQLTKDDESIYLSLNNYESWAYNVEPLLIFNHVTKGEFKRLVTNASTTYKIGSHKDAFDNMRRSFLVARKAVREAEVEALIGGVHKAKKSGEHPFTSEEKESAQVFIKIKNIDNFQGVLGSVSDSSLEQNLSINISKGDFSALKSHLEKHGIPDEDISDLENRIEADGNVHGEGVNAWIGKIMQKVTTGAIDLAIKKFPEVVINPLLAYFEGNS
ncbi:hypothetical protein [Microbulbifer variabilis]|uniref:hypothetical protein n=1 Tax=Microbulbifer variabilis TaxID=266805 RepID=UPI001CFCEB0D|nr:hypothetical protein [Microbulbifer variabilis]